MNTRIILVKDTIQRPTSSTSASRKIIIAPGQRNHFDSPVRNTDYDELTHLDRYSVVIEYLSPVALMYAPMTRTNVNFDGSRFTPGYQNSPLQVYIDTAFVVGGFRSSICTTSSDFIAIARGASDIIAGSCGLIVAGEGSTITCGDFCMVVAEPHFNIATRAGTVLDVDGPGVVTIYDLDGNTAEVSVENGIRGVATPLGIVQPNDTEMKSIISRLPLNMIDYSSYSARMGTPYRMRVATS